MKGKGANLPDPTLGSLPAPIVVQLVNSVTPICWESTFNSGAVIDNDAATFKAKFPN